MLSQRYFIPILGFVTLFGATDLAHAQRGHGGVARPAGGMARPAGGMARPGGMTRPAMPANRPAMARPAMPMNRPNMANLTRPAMPINRPNVGNMARPSMPVNRPNIGNVTRPSLPGQIGGNRPGIVPGRPGTLPGPIGSNRPGPGGGNRPGPGGPVPLPGPIGGNRPGPGGGNRPGWANRPGAGGGGIQWPGGNRPGWANRPGAGGGGTQWPGGNRPPWGIGNRPGGIGNRPWGSGNWGIGGGNNIGSGNVTGGNTIGSGNTIVNNNGGWGGGGWGGGYHRPIYTNNYYLGGGWGGGRWGGGWAAPYYGNWYRGGWGGNGFWAGFGTGALTSFGLGTLGSVLGYGGYGYGGLGYGYPSYYSGYGVYDYFPTWGVSNYTSWGLGSLTSNWLYSGYSNPYYSSLVAALPAQTTVIYDYSQPINVAAEAPNPATATSSEQVFSAARDAFMAGDYQRALDLADQVVKDTPNVPVVHEFRGLCLFALKRFDEAAAVEYAVLSSGPGWNWATLVGLYPDVDTYTNQLRALEASVRSNPNSPSLHFLLAYHYMIQGHKDAAASQFTKVAQLQPNDQLSASFVKALKKVLEQPQQQPAASAAATVASTAQPGEGAASAAPAQLPATAEQPQEQPEPPPPPPASLVGTWRAQPSADLAIALTLQADGQFTWEVDSKGQKQTLTGQAGYKDGTLALLQEEGPPLVGKVAQQGDNKFTFSPPTGANAQNPGLTFIKS